MNSLGFFWAVAGFMAGLAAAFFALSVWRSGDGAGWVRRNLWLLATLVVFAIGALAIYAKVGRPPAVAAGNGLPADHATNAGATQSGGEAAGSIADATARLAAKLASGEGSDADWQLLQKSYEFMGDSAAAALAAQHKLPDNATSPAGANVSPSSDAPLPTTASSPASDISAYQKRVTDNPNDAAAWRAMAESYRASRKFSEANAAFGELIRLKAMDADTWSDYADSAASQSGSLSNELTRNALAAALKLNKQHPKSLWLQASLLLEEKRYAESLKTWRQLRALIDDASPDAKIIDANIAEAESLSGSSAAAVPASSAKPVSLQGTVNVDAALVSKSKGMTLFVFAKAPDSPMPVAVYRAAVTSWPVKFALDDSQAVMPTRKLSDVSQVVVQARLSQSGQAVAQPGDWQSEAVMLGTRDGKSLSLTIRQPVTGKAGP